MIMEASRKALEALISPSAAITLALASLLASASAAMARCNCSGNLASFLKNENFIKKWEFALVLVTNSVVNVSTCPPRWHYNLLQRLTKL